MLKLDHRPAARYKCLKHPRQKYGESEGALPASCAACHTIWRVRRAHTLIEAAAPGVTNEGETT